MPKHTCTFVRLDRDANGTTYTIDLEGVWEFDSDYGADADGRRGVPAWSLEAVTITDLHIDIQNNGDMWPDILNVLNDVMADAKAIDNAVAVEPPDSL